MASKKMLLGCLNNLLVSYSYLIKAENEKDDVLYNNALQRIRFYRMLEDKLLTEANINKMLKIAKLYAEVIYKNQIRQSANAALISKTDMLCGFLSSRIDNLNKKLKRETESNSMDAYFKEYDKNTLLSIKEMVENEKNPKFKRQLVETYYLFIFMNPHIESELLENPSLLNVPNTNFRRFARENKDSINVHNYNMEVLLFIASSFVFSYSEEPTDSKGFSNQTLLLGILSGALLGLPKKYVYEFKELCSECFSDYGTNYAVSKLFSLIDKRLKSSGYSKIVSIVP